MLAVHPHAQDGGALLDNLAFCFTREGQDEQAQDIDQRDGARSARKCSEVDHEIARQERPCGSEDAASVKAESGSCGSDAGGENFRQLNSAALGRNQKQILRYAALRSE